MNSVQVKLTAALLLSIGLAGCVPATTATKGEDSPSTIAGPALPAVDDPVLYASRSDSNFTIPALPIEQIPAGYRRQEVKYETTEVPGTIIIDPSKRVLYFVTGKNEAIRYGIAVGAEGFGWSGVSDVTNKRHWPTWTPPREMISRKPELAKWANGQPGGLTNPLGSRAIYLTTNGVDHGYRIHGTPEWKSIGRNASSGCFRMINQDVMDLYERVPMGAKVVVLNRDGSYPTKLTIPQQPKPKKVAPKPEEALVPAALVTTPEPGLTTDPATPEATTPAAAVPATPSLTVPSVTEPADVTPAPTAVVPEVATPEVGVPEVVTPVVPPAPVPVTPTAPAEVTTAPAPAATTTTP